MQLETDENQNSEGNAGNLEGRAGSEAGMLGTGTLHLPAFERLIKVMNRLDDPNSWVPGTLPVTHTSLIV